MSLEIRIRLDLEKHAEDAITELRPDRLVEIGYFGAEVIAVVGRLCRLQVVLNLMHNMHLQVIQLAINTVLGGRMEVDIFGRELHILAFQQRVKQSDGRSF